jgi:hypothetical protein
MRKKLLILALLAVANVFFFTRTAFADDAQYCFWDCNSQHQCAQFCNPFGFGCGGDCGQPLPMCCT